MRCRSLLAACTVASVVLSSCAFASSELSSSAQQPADEQSSATSSGSGQSVDDEKVTDDIVVMVYPPMPEGQPPVRPVPDTLASSEAEMKAYTEPIPGGKSGFDMLPIPSGSFVMGSPESEDDRDDSEGPQHEVSIAPFWMSKLEIRWDEYHLFQFRLDIEARKGGVEPNENDSWADAVSRPTPPYVPMDFEMGEQGYPAICMTQFAARQFTKWLSMKTGRFYRLPTEAEWEYACRAGTSTAYSFGDDPDELENHAWYFDNADDQYQLVGTKEPNPWGLHDMHGNVAEWVLDGWFEDGYTKHEAGDPLVWPTTLYPRIVRGGSWDDDPDRLRSAARRKSSKVWKVQDPQLPKSIWYHTDAQWIGVRLVRPLAEPSEEMKTKYWEADLDDVREIQEKQRRGGR